MACFSAISPTPGWAAQWVDEFGRKVNIPDDPKRIVSLAPSITEIIFALNQEGRLKGVTQFSDFPPEALKLPSVGSYVHLDLEKIVSLKPDLCIATKDGNPIKIIERLENLHIPIYVVNPKNLESVMKTISRHRQDHPCRRPRENHRRGDAIQGKSRKSDCRKGAG